MNDSSTRVMSPSLALTKAICGVHHQSTKNLWPQGSECSFMIGLNSTFYEIYLSSIQICSYYFYNDPTRLIRPTSGRSTRNPFE